MEGPLPVLDYPMHVYWNITSICNLRCDDCLSRSGRARSGELTHSEALALVGELVEHRLFYLYIAGGEPFLRKDLFEVVEAATSKGIVVTLATNGTYVTESKLRRLKEANVKEVMVSLDGADAETHDRFRGVTGAFEDAIRAMNLIKEGGFRLTVGSVIRRQIIDQLDSMYSVVAANRADSWRLTGVSPVGRGDAIYRKVGLKIEDIRKIVAFVDSRRAGSTKVLLDDPLPTKLWPLLGKTGNRPGKCGAGRTLCCIQYDGTVTPCELFDLPIGNIREKSLKVIWDTSPELMQIRGVVPESAQGKCQRCSVVSQCNSGCRAQSWFEYGSLVRPDPLCLRVERESAV